jgi:hypothetical protein
MSLQQRHHCHANGCHAITPGRYFMCVPHWRLLTANLQTALRNALRERGSNPFYQPYYEACANAVEYVAMREGRQGFNSFRRVAAALSRPEHPLHNQAYRKGAKMELRPTA